MPNWEKRELNRRMSAKMLEDNDIEFASLNGGAHLKVVFKGRTIDFWPGTGLWRHGDEEGRGVKNLMEYLKPKDPSKVKMLSVRHLFEIAKKSKVQSLYGICESIHREIYK